MTNATQALEFQGRVRSQRGEAPLGLILIGNTSDRRAEETEIAFSTTAAEDIPEILNDVRVDRLGERQYRIISGPRQWTVAAAAHVHRDVGDSFQGAVPPRGVPWHKRAFWRLALSIASTGLGQRMFFRSR